MPLTCVRVAMAAPQRPSHREAGAWTGGGVPRSRPISSREAWPLARVKARPSATPRVLRSSTTEDAGDLRLKRDLGRAVEEMDQDQLVESRTFVPSIE